MARAFTSASISASCESSRRSSSSASWATARDCTTPSWSSSTCRCVPPAPALRTVSAFRRSNAPCRCWNSPKRRNVMSIALCSSSGLLSTMYAKTPRAAASLTQTPSYVSRSAITGQNASATIRRSAATRARRSRRGRPVPRLGAACRDCGHVGDVDLSRITSWPSPSTTAASSSSRSDPLIRDQDAKVVNAIQALPSVAEGKTRTCAGGQTLLTDLEGVSRRTEIVANTTNPAPVRQKSVLG